jgi:hypothetical protein
VWHVKIKIAHFRWGIKAKIDLELCEKLSNVTSMKCRILSPISDQTAFALAKGVKAVFWSLKTRLLVLVFSLFKGLSICRMIGSR